MELSLKNIEAPKSEYLSIVRKNSNDRVYLLFSECKREDYNGDVSSKVYGDEFALVACRFCRKKQKQFCPDSNESYCGGAYFHCEFCERFNDPDHDYHVQGKIYEYSGLMCLNDEYDKKKYTRAIKNFKRIYKELEEELKALKDQEAPSSTA